MANKSVLRNFLVGDRLEAGCDEAGRGPLAGPVFAAAVILPPDFFHPLLNDSKKMTEKARETLRPVIEKEAIAFSVVSLDAEEIDRMNILNASLAGMWRSVMDLSIRPDFILVDGNRFKPYDLIPSGRPPGSDSYADKFISGKYGTVPYKTIVGGDATFASIAAASVLAKTCRDDYMKELSKICPEYGWDRNKGYPTKDHIEAIRKWGYSPYHRKSFHLKELEPTLF